MTEVGTTAAAEADDASKASGLADAPATIQETMAARGLTPPSVHDYALLVDLHRRVMTYLGPAADEWFDRYQRTRPDITLAHCVSVVGFNADAVTYEFCAHLNDADQGDLTTVTIPIGDLLPEYGALRSVLTALGKVRPDE